MCYQEDEGTSHRLGEKIFLKDVSDKGLLSKYTKNSENSITENEQPN